MSVTRRIVTAALFLLASAIVFSPLASALVATSSNLQHTVTHFAAPLSRSMLVSFVAATVALFLGLPFAVLVDRSRPAVRRTCWALALVTLIVPPYIVAESTIVLFGPAGKISRGAALLCGMGPPSSDAVARARFTVSGFVYTAPMAGAVLGGCFFPIVALAVASANRRTDRRTFESARLMQGRRGVVVVAAHALLPTASGAAMLVFAVALTESVVPQLLRVQTIGGVIYERIQEGNLPGAAELSLPLLPIILLSGTAGAFVLLRARAASMAGLEGEVPKFTVPFAGRPADIAAMSVAGAAIIPALLVPLVGLSWLLVTATLPASTGGAHRVLRASGFFESLGGAWDLARGDALRTIVLATLTATLAIAFAVALVRPLSRTRRGAITGLLGAGLAVPASVVGLGLIVLWNRGAGTVVYQSVAIVMLGWLARFLPVGVLLSQAALVRVPIELEQAAALAGRGPRNRFFAVVLPVATPGLAAAWLAMYVLSATEFVATLLIAPPGAALLAPSVVNLMRRGQDPEIAACQVLLLAVVATPLAVLSIGWIVRSRGRTR